VPSSQGFINFNLTAQAIVIRTNHRRAKAVQHRPRRLIGAEAQQALKRLGRDPIKIQIDKSEKENYFSSK
jgi:hypothetical protein